MNLPIELYTDGSCINNPGPGGIAYIAKYYITEEDNTIPKSYKFEYSEGYRLTTNNRMEIKSVIKGLNDIHDKLDSIPDVNTINIYLDSKYVCDTINSKWIDKWMENNWMTSGYKNSPPKPVKNKDLWLALLDVRSRIIKKGIISITLNHVKGHNGHEYNEACDKLAKKAANNSSEYLVDTGYEK